MKILYLVYFDVNSERQTGVNKKIKNQVNALRKLGNEVILAGCNKDRMYFDNGNTIDTKPIKYGFTHYRWSVKKTLNSEELDFDVVYIRFPGTIEPVFFHTMKMLSRKGAKIILELPTYPIGNELKRFLHDEFKSGKVISLIIHGSAFLFHRLLSRRLKSFVSRIVTFMPFSEIWGIKTIQIDNGVDIDACQVINKNISKENTIRLITVARVSIWHGIDRIISGIELYYKTKKNTDADVRLTIVGDGPVCKDLEQMIAGKSIENKINFVGSKFGDDLMREYENSDIAIGSLGMHRIDVINGSTLKVKEYCSLGIPFVYAYNERYLNASFKYALKLVADDSPIDINQIIQFYNKLNMNIQCSMEMHQFAINHYTWEKQMKIVIDQLEA